VDRVDVSRRSDAATPGRIGFARTLVHKLDFNNEAGARMREVMMVYLCGVILLLAVSTTIDREERVGLDHIVIAAFGWPIFTSILALKALSNR
jgi:hypothetical protein